MADNWYYAEDGTSVGPLKFADLKAILRQRQNWKNVLVWHSGYESWQPAGTVGELGPSTEVPPPPPPAVPTPQPSVTESVAAPEAPVSEEATESKWLWAVGGVFGFVAIVIGAAIGKVGGRAVWEYFTRPPPEQLTAALSNGLREGLAQVKPTLPKKISEYITFVDARVEGTTAVYVHVLDTKNYEIVGDFLGKSKQAIAAQACASAMRPSLDMGATYRYEYKGSRGEHIGVVSLTKADCR